MEELLSVHEGEIPPSYSLHIDTCSICQTLLMDLVEANAFPQLELQKGSLNSIESLVKRLKMEPAIQSRPFCDRETQFAPGDRLEQYEIEMKIAEGGFAEVYLAHDIELGRKVALKIPFEGKSEKQLGRIKKEARALALLSHPNLVPVYEIGSIRGRMFIVSEYCDGETLAVFMRRHPRGVSPQIAVRVLYQITEAIQYSHARGIVHCDLKPANIVLQGDSKKLARVLDFGLAKNTDWEDSISIEGKLVGTPAFMSPEQAAGKSTIGAASDLFSLGTLFFVLLTGENPFQSKDLLKTLQLIQQPDSNRIRQLAKGIPKDLRAIIEKCWRTEPAERYPNALQLAQDLDAWLHGKPVSVRSITSVQRLVRYGKRQPIVALTALVAFVSLVLGTTFSTWNWLDAKASLATSKFEYQRAEDNLELANEALVQEKRARLRAERIAEFLGRTYRKPKPDEEGREIKVVDLLERAESEIQTEFADDNEMRLQLLQQIGNAYVGLGLQEDCIRVLEAVRAQSTELEMAKDDRSLLIAYDLAVAYHNLGEFEKSLELIDEVLNEGQDRSKPLKEQSFIRIKLHGAKANVLSSLGRYTEADQIHKNIITYLKSNPSEHGVLLAKQNLAYGTSLFGQRRLVEAREVLTEAVRQLEESLGSDDPTTLLAKNSLLNVLQSQDGPASTLLIRQELFESSERVMGPNHTQTFMMMNNLAATYNIAGQPLESVRMYEELFRRSAIIYTSDSPFFLIPLESLANVYRGQEQFDVAEELYAQSYVGFRDSLGVTNQRFINCAIRYADVKEALEDWNGATEIWSTIEEATENSQGEPTTQSVSARLRRGITMIYLGETEEGLRLSKSAFEYRFGDAQSEAPSPSSRLVKIRLGLALISMHEHEHARQWIESLEEELLASATETAETESVSRSFAEIAVELLSIVLAIDEGGELDVVKAQLAQFCRSELEINEFQGLEKRLIASCINQTVERVEQTSDIDPDHINELREKLRSVAAKPIPLPLPQIPFRSEQPDQ